MCNDFFFTKATIWSQIYCQTPLGGCRLFHSNPNLEQMHFYDWFLKRAAIYLCNLREKTLPSSLFPLSSFVKINMHCSTVLGRLLFMLAIHSMWLAVRNSSGQFQKAKFSLSLSPSFYRGNFSWYTSNQSSPFTSMLFPRVAHANKTWRQQSFSQGDHMTGNSWICPLF